MAASEELPIEELPPATEEEAGGTFEVPAPPTTTPPLRPSLRPVEIRLPVRHNPPLQRILAQINADVDLQALWRCANVTAVDRLHMSDHGPVHVQIVANIALRLLRLLVARGVQPSVVRDHGLANEDAEVVVALGALLHDLGMAVQRDGHEELSVVLAAPKIRELLAAAYQPPVLSVLSVEILHTILAHRAGSRPITLEAGIVRVADALDMAKGRSRIPFEAGQINIHSVSAAAIDQVQILAGEIRPVRVVVHMNNSAGIFQLDELLREKLKGSGLEPHVEVNAEVAGESERRLVPPLHL